MASQVTIRGFGHYVPEQVLTNADLEGMVETNDEWIVSRTGIKERRIAAPDQVTSDLSFHAAQMALKDANMEAEELTHIIVGTFTPDAMIPSTACVLQDKLGAKNGVAFDISAACSSFLYALENARGILVLHPEAKVLIVGADIVTSRINFGDRNTCILFGDGAGAAIVANGGDGAKLINMKISADGSLGDLLTSYGGSSFRCTPGATIPDDFFVTMNGREVYKHAVRSMTDIATEVLTEANYTMEDVDVLVPHQANVRIIEAVGKRLKVAEDKVFVNVHNYGNTSAAALPIGISEAVHQNFIKKGNLVSFVTFGGGFTWGSALLQF